MATVQMIWCREDRTQVPGPGQTFPTTNDANAYIRRLVGHTGGERSEPGRRTYDVVAVTVP